MVLLSPVAILLGSNSCGSSECKQSCAAKLEDLSLLPKENRDAYARAKQLFSGDASGESMSLDDLTQALETAKENNDFETHAEAYHRLKVELSTEDDGDTVVLKLKELGIPVAITAGVVSVAAYLLHTYVNNNAAKSA
jgi:hypothetical protein